MVVKSFIQPIQNGESCELSRQDKSNHIAKAPIAEETDESNNSSEVSNNWSQYRNEQ